MRPYPVLPLMFPGDLETLDGPSGTLPPQDIVATIGSQFGLKLRAFRAPDDLDLQEDQFVFTAPDAVPEFSGKPAPGSVPPDEPPGPRDVASHPESGASAPASVPDGPPEFAGKPAPGSVPPDGPLGPRGLGGDREASRVAPGSEHDGPPIFAGKPAPGSVPPDGPPGPPDFGGTSEPEGAWLDLLAL